MKQNSLSRYIAHYEVFKEAIISNKNQLEIVGYRRKERIAVNEKLKAFVDIIEKLKNEIVDKETLSVVHMSASTFYRIKNYICEKVILLCAIRGLVSETEILKSINIKQI